MVEGFESLNEEQFATCKNSVAWITALIAISDGVFDKKEADWAKKIAEIRTYSSPDILLPFYKEVGQDFNEVLASTLESLPEDNEAKKSVLSAKLEKLNAILPLLDNKLAYKLYKSFQSFAKHVAKSSGGFLGFFSISSEEKSLMDLPMVNPIEYIDEEE
ncbi:MAG: hypothetical protein HKN09_11790 [Saprospiraceae bacterium]|nr:hypothetical protein [Saprospiraceae bacterium]